LKQQLHATTETWDFDADSQQPTSVSTDTFYSNIEINCPELVFDASDVPDKIRYKFITGSEKIDAQHKLLLQDHFRRVNFIVIMEDSGVGMIKNKMINSSQLLLTRSSRHHEVYGCGWRKCYE